MEVSVVEQELRVKAEQAIKEMNKLTASAQGYAAQLANISNYLDQINKKSLSNINKQINNVTHSNNIANQNIGTNYDFGNHRKAAKSSTGAVMVSDTGREKVFRDYEQAIIDETIAIRKDIEKRTKTRERRLRAEEARNQNTAAAIAKREDKSSQAYADRQDTLAQAQLLKAKAMQQGALNRNWKYQTGRGLQNLGGIVSGMGTGGKLVGLGLDTAGAMLKAPALGTAAAITNLAKGISDLGKEAVKSFAEIESIKTQLGVVFSNQTQANSMFGEISQYAVKSPFGVQQTSELAVLLKQSGVYASDLMNTLKMIGDTAGGNMEKMKRIANNYAQIVSIGKASMLDMRQFAYAGIPIFEAVSKELGVSQQELRKLISDGKVTSDIIEKVFKDLTGINGIFENATEKGAQTLKARLQNLQDAKQLAFGEGGRWLTSLGTKTGNDSYANETISWFEKLYNSLEKWLERGNIAKDVKTIAQRNNRISELQSLIESNKDNKDLKELFERELKKELTKRDADVERNTYAQSYDVKTGRLKDALDALSGLAYSDVGSRIKQLGGANFSWLKNIPSVSELWGENFYSVIERYASDLTTSDEYKALSDDQQKELKDLFKELIAAMKDYNNLTAEDLKANRERNLQNAQQSAFDSMNSMSDRSTSLLSKFRDISSAYRDTDKYKEQEEKKRVQTLSQALEVLKDIRKNTDENGRVDITKFSASQLSDYIKQGAFSASEKLDVVTGNAEIDKQNRADLMKQYGHIASLTGNFMKVALTDPRYAEKTSKFESYVLQDLAKLSDSEFYEQFPKTYEQQTKALDDLISGLSDTDGRKQMLQMYRSLLDYSLNKIETDVTGADAEAGDLSKGNKNQFIPLWKRILSQYTGLTTNGMTDTFSTMSNYRDDMAVRNMTSGVLTATMKSMGIDKAMSLMRTKSAVQLAGDSGKTFQIDWQATRKAIKDFSTQLSASTEVISAYKKGLEDELNTYEQLVAAGYTQAESTDLGSQKFVSTKQLEKLANGNSSQLVNAFGEIIKTKSGLTYNTSDITFENGKMFDKFGNEINEEVQITGKLFEFIKGELPRLYQELHEANAAELNNKKLNSMLADVTPTMYMGQYLASNGVTKNTSPLLQDSAYINSFINTKLTELKNSEKYKDFKNINNEDILLDSLTKMSKYQFYKNALSEAEKLPDSKVKDAEIATAKDELKELGQSAELLDAVFVALENNINKLNSTPEGQALLARMAAKSRDESVMTDYIAAKNYTAYGLTDPTNLKPRDYTGERGTRNRLFEFFTGTELKYDREDYLAQAVKDPDFRKKINEQRVGDWVKSGYKEGPLELLPEDNESILKMTNEELAKMLSYSEQIGVTWEKSSEELSKGFEDISKNTSSMFRDFTSSAITSTFETWGKYLGDSSKASEEIGKNFQSLSANLFKNMGQMVTQAGLSLAISSIGDKGKVLTGLAIAAAGGGFSMLGGMIDQDNDDDKENDAYQKLLKVKQDLSDLLKQAREDAIYYETTVRHKKAISANDYLTKSVHDAVITPRGDIVTTDPKDYLIATKTPNTLVGGGAPTINFSVVDKSTGIKVTQQRSTYNEETNTIEFEAIIESKVQEVIATSKGDEAFAARQARLSGRSVVA